MKFCGKCGNKLFEGNVFCMHCGAKIEDMSPDANISVAETVVKEQSVYTPPAPTPVPVAVVEPEPEITAKIICPNCGAENLLNRVTCSRCCRTIDKEKLVRRCTNCNSLMADNVHVCPVCKSSGFVNNFLSHTYNSNAVNKVNVKGGTYIGKKWFLKLPYKTYETDVEFTDKSVKLSQGTGFVSAGYKYDTEIEYKNIMHMSVKSKFSIPNIVAAVAIAILSIATEIFAGLIPVAVIIFIGKTATLSILHSCGEYIVPTEFKSEAEELQIKINQAKHQAG